MTEITLISAFLIGIAGSVHCVGMCGGIVSALTFSLPKNQPQMPFHIAYNIGRISSYSIAGALTGTLGGIFSHQIANGLNWLQLFSAIFLVLLGLYIGEWWRGLTYLERLGKKGWKYIQPLSKAFVPLKHPLYALPYGVIWGWLPCGLVYSTLTWSLAASDGLTGALIMLFFGLGTLPVLILIGLSSNQTKLLFAAQSVRKVISLMLLAFGFVLIYLLIARLFIG